MDFRLSKEQQDIVKAARKFAVGEFTDKAQEFDREEKILEIYEGTKEMEKTIVARSLLGK